MAWLLCRAVVRCQRRRILALLGDNPAAWALALALVAAAPWLLSRMGEAVGDDLGPTLGDVATARAVVVAPLLAGLATGAALAVGSAGRVALGTQLAAGPVGERAAAVACVLAPIAVVGTIASPFALAFALPLGSGTPGGALAGVGLLAAGLVAVSAGALIAESALHLRAGAWLSALPVAALAVVWAGVGKALGSPLLGPLGPAGSALAGQRHPIAAIALGLLAAGIATWAWVELLVRRPPRAAAPGRSGRLRPHRRLPVALAVAAVALLCRRADIRLGILAAVFFGLGGVVLGRRAGVPPPAPLQLGASSALLGAALGPLAVGGILLRGRWLWAASPRGRVGAVAALCTTSVAALLGAPGLVGMAAALASGATLRAVLELGFVAGLVAAAAVAAGAVVPWRGVAIGDQVASIGAFGIGLAGLSSLAGIAGPRLVEEGIPALLSAVLVLVAATGGAAGLLVVRLARRS